MTDDGFWMQDLNTPQVEMERCDSKQRLLSPSNLYFSKPKGQGKGEREREREREERGPVDAVRIEQGVYLQRHGLREDYHIALADSSVTMIRAGIPFRGRRRN